MGLSINKAFLKIHKHIAASQPRQNFLLGGKSGLAFYYFSLYQALDKPCYANKSIEIIEEVINNNGDSPFLFQTTSFANGTAGLCYLLTHLQLASLTDFNMEEDFKEPDELIFIDAIEFINKNQFDFLYGAAGALHYFNLRCNEKSIRQYIEKIAEALFHKVVVKDDRAWFLNSSSAEGATIIDLSLSHGNTAILLVLLSCMENGIMKPELTGLIEKCISFILSLQTSTIVADERHPLFPIMLSDILTDRKYSQRLGWCYGDLNIVLLLYRAASVLNKPEWKQAADSIGEKVVMRMDTESTLVTDSHFCHGSSGLAQYYHILFVVSGNSTYEKAAKYWIEQTLNYVKTELQGEKYSGKEHDLLEGLTGINLTLLSFMSNKKINWSGVFLL
jgi:lantibiotic biosynthesis protein